MIYHLQWQRVLCFLALLVVGATGFGFSNSVEQVTVLRSGFPHDALYDIDFFDSKGLDVGDNGAILSSHNGGADWQLLPAFTELALTGVSLSIERVIIVGQQGVIFTGSLKGGYQLVASPTTERLMSVALTPGGLAVAVGGFGTVLVSESFGED